MSGRIGLFDYYLAILNRKILEPVLPNLNGERQACFYRIVEKQRWIHGQSGRLISSIWFVKETVPFLPTYLELDLLIENLLTFVRDNRHAMN